MSRTDKDRPYEIRLHDSHEATVEHHNHTPVYRYCVTGEETYTVRERDWLRSWDYIHSCDVKAYKNVTRTRTRTRRFAVAFEAVCDIDEDPLGRPTARRWSHCYRSFLYKERWRSTNVPKWYTDHIWNDPERVRVRDGLRAAAREYNAGENLSDFDFPNYQHRHCAGWYWD